MFVFGLSAILILDAVFTIGRSYVTGWSAARLQHILGVTMVERLLGAELNAVESVAPGVLIQPMRAIDTIKSFYAGQAMLAAIDLPFVILFLTIMALIGGQLVMFPIAALILTVIAGVITGKTLRGALKERAIRDERRQNFVVEVLSKTTTIKALGLEQFLCRRYERLQGASAEMSFWVTFHSSIARSIGGLFPQITMAGVAAYGATMVMAGELTVGSLAACTFLAGDRRSPRCGPSACGPSFNRSPSPRRTSACFWRSNRSKPARRPVPMSKTERWKAASSPAGSVSDTARIRPACSATSTSPSSPARRSRYPAPTVPARRP